MELGSLRAHSGRGMSALLVDSCLPCAVGGVRSAAAYPALSAQAGASTIMWGEWPLSCVMVAVCSAGGSIQAHRGNKSHAHACQHRAHSTHVPRGQSLLQACRCGQAARGAHHMHLPTLPTWSTTSVTWKLYPGRHGLHVCAHTGRASGASAATRSIVPEQLLFMMRSPCTQAHMQLCHSAPGL